MSNVRTGATLKDFSDVPSQELKSIKFNTEWLYANDPQQIGPKTEGYVRAVLSLFQGVVRKVHSNSPLDKLGVDVLIRGTGKTLGLQIKSSEFYFSEFLAHPSKFYENIIVLWVDIQSWQSRRALFMGLLPILMANGINLKPEIIKIVRKRDMFFKKGIQLLPLQKGAYAGFSSEEIQVLTALGISRIYKGDLVV
jgi:hypothetical protein